MTETIHATRRRRIATLVASVIICVTLSAQTSSAIPDGPTVWLDEHHYHIRKDCPELQGVVLRSATLHQAIASLRTDCPVCKPYGDPQIRKYIETYLHAISEEVDAPRRAAAAEAAQQQAAARARADADAALRKIGKADAMQILRTVTDDLANPKYEEPVKDLERSTFRLIFQSQAVKINKFFDGSPVVIAPNKDLTVSVIGPATFFAIAAGEQLRKLKPVSVGWVDAVAVLVMPQTVQTPDIEQVVLRSNGMTVPPLAGALTADVFTTMMGAKTTAHSGLLFYPAAAFAADAKAVELMLIPKTGDNTIHLFTVNELRRIQ